ncbi:MAG: UDP-N-acetylmuramoyl-L-alanyl-D-glutamate--2,6-diaminopimelate ligase [Planctomycetes bacterium]|nr:UDP-N-acetylmuramoyl-L-alanyl-D-glutamate--2,6-diaminopimelate ligase [Planctomycetota bacterium]
MATIGTRSPHPLSDAQIASNRLDDLLRAVAPLAVEGDAGACVSALATDSRRVRPNALFFAVPGVREDGARYLAEAVRNGACAVVVEGDVEVPRGVAVVRVADCRLAKALIAARFFRYPARTLPVVGITGTNGKTTTSYMLRAIADYDGGPTVLIGTIAYEVGGVASPAPNTTPDPIDLHGHLARGVLRGARLAVMEVSSHALAQRRVAGVDFQAAVFTNLTPEHLDYHGTFEAYREAKAELFTALAPSAVAVLNADDPAAAEIARRTRARVVRYGLKGAAEVTARVRRVDIDGVSFILRTPQGEVDVNTSLPGSHNLQNALAACAAAIALGFPLESVHGGFQLLKRVPGRLEPVDCGQDFRVLVDYAHTDDALSKVLETLRPLTKGRIITVFGCGGDRDRSKRPRMGRVAAALSDMAIVTSDNPRSEDPNDIIAAILSGIPSGCRVDVEPDRRRAIRQALLAARGGDIVLIAGKGHEDYQLVGGERIDFDDCAVAKEVLWSL